MFLMQRKLKLRNKFAIPFGVFLLVFSIHLVYSVWEASQINKQWVEVEDINYYLLYFNQQYFMMGISYALACAFTIYALLVFNEKRKKNGIAGIFGASTLAGLIYGGGCFLIGCCGSPMLAIYIGLFGPSILGFTKLLVLILTILSVAAGWFWIERNAKECSCADKNECN